MSKPAPDIDQLLSSKSQPATLCEPHGRPVGLNSWGNQDQVWGRPACPRCMWDWYSADGRPTEGESWEQYAERWFSERKKARAG